ncbi:MAG: VCBS repeat-containing protein [Deltaproteobacteria bacterium]|nr:VCBS repeat-containing protein [Deltaproteobacteria bacterium]
MAHILKQASRFGAGLLALSVIWGGWLPLEGPARAAGERMVHQWERVFYGRLDGRESLLFADAIRRARPALGDLDGDGDLDMLMGTADGKIMVFQNQGDSKHPLWRLVNDTLKAAPAGASSAASTINLTAVDVGANSAPALVDIDGDDDLDLFVGNAQGKLLFYINDGNRYIPRFRLVSSDFLGADFGFNLVPRFVDANGDGLPDLSVGNEEGEVVLLPNQGSKTQAWFCTSPKGDRCPPPQKLAKLTNSDNAVPEWVDWDHDGDWDLMVGRSDGKVSYFRNVGNRVAGSWELTEERFMILDAGGYSDPVFSDVNGDGRPDLLLFSDGDQVAFYRNTLRGQVYDLWLEEPNLLGAAKLGGNQSNPHPAWGDLDADGDNDLIIGTHDGQLLVYMNVSKKGDIAFQTTGKPLLYTPKRSDSAPALADIDGDGDLDLVVGDKNGRLELILNTGTPRKPSWEIQSLFFGSVDVGAVSTPVFYDLDEDGDLDLVVGNSLGNVVYFENKGSRTRPDFFLRSVRFGEMKVGAYASPAVFRWDLMAPPDLVLGTQSGLLVSAQRQAAKPVTSKDGWAPPKQPWSGVRAKSYSAPQFVDLTGDGHPDLLMGAGDGSLGLWRYVATQKAGQTASEERPGNKIPEHGEGYVLEEEPKDAPGANDLENRQDLALEIRKDVARDPIFSAESIELTRLPVGKNSFPAFFDYNNDGALDLVVGTAKGSLELYLNQGPPQDPAWEKVTDQFAGARAGRNAAPVFADVDGDGDLDLVVGNEAGRVQLYENLGPPGAPAFRLNPKAMTGVRTGRNAAPVFADLDGDGQMELLTGSLRDGVLYFKRKPGSLPDYQLEQRQFLGFKAGVNATPAVGDITIAKTTTLLVGSDKGPVAVFTPTGTSPFRATGWQANTTFMQGLALPPGSHPVLTDLDLDGDPDLVVGSDKGPLVFFRNNAILATRQAADSGK